MKKLLNKLDLGTRNEVLDKLDKLRKYSFCKSRFLFLCSIGL